MDRVKGDYWKVSDKVVKLQIKTKKEQYKLEEALPGWSCVSFGYAPKTSEDIYVFERSFESELDLSRFLNSDSINKIMEIREVVND